MRLNRKFFEKPTLEVARNLLGQILVRRFKKKEIRGVICETEAYVGEKDKACHASRGRTPRSEVLFWEAGRAYVYLIYGMHYCFNIVTEKKDFPSAVLIRGALIDGEKITGPGRVCKFFKIDKKFNGRDLIGNKSLWFSAGGGPAGLRSLRRGVIKKYPRVGVEYAGLWAKKPWRFTLI